MSPQVLARRRLVARIALPPLVPRRARGRLPGRRDPRPRRRGRQAGRRRRRVRPAVRGRLRRRSARGPPRGPAEAARLGDDASRRHVRRRGAGSGGRGRPALVLRRHGGAAGARPALRLGGEDAGDVRLPKALALAGRVVDESGGPVVGATVTLWPGDGRRAQDVTPAAAVPQAAATKADGTFRFETAAEEGNRIRVEAPAFATQERQPVRAGALARPVTLALGQVLRGTVTLADRRRRPGRPRALRGPHADDPLGRDARGRHLPPRRRAARGGRARGGRRRPRPCLGRAGPGRSR